MSEKDISQARDPLLRLSFPALRRAARRAREEAIRYNTDLIQVRDGKVVRISPTAEDAISIKDGSVPDQT